MFCQRHAHAVTKGEHGDCWRGRSWRSGRAAWPGLLATMRSCPVRLLHASSVDRALLPRYVRDQCRANPLLGDWVSQSGGRALRVQQLILGWLGLDVAWLLTLSFSGNGG